jgi:hypothetical protein
MRGSRCPRTADYGTYAPATGRTEALKNSTHRNGPSELATLPMPARTYRDSFVDSTCFRKASTRPNVFISSRSARRQPGEKMP